MPDASLRRWRAETPGSSERIHLNNAGAALQPEPVLRAVREHFDLEARIGGYEAADARSAEIDGVYRAVAELLGTSPRSVAITENATAAFVQALSAVPFSPGDVVVTTRNDYASNQIQYLSLAERMGVEVVRAPDGPEGGVDVDALEGLVHRRRPKLVAVSHVPTSSGLVQDVETIGRICRDRDVLYLVDACQSVGQMPVRPEEIGADFLSATARKFLRGPRGVGFLWVSDRVIEAGLEPLFPDLRGADWITPDLYQPAPDATRFENWEFPYALVLGLGEAARYALDVGLETARDRSRALAERLREGIEALDRAECLDRGEEVCSIVTLRPGGLDPGEVVRELRAREINTSSLTRVSAVLDFEEKGVEGALRVSPHYYNTEAEVDDFLAALEEVLAEPTGGSGAPRLDPHSTPHEERP